MHTKVDFRAVTVSKCRNEPVTIHASFKTRLLLLMGQVDCLPLLQCGLLYLIYLILSRSASADQMVVSKTKKICFGVCIDPQLLQFIKVTNYTPSILSSWFSRWSCNICLNFPLAKMYHCGCTDKYNFGFPALHIFIHFIRVAILHHFEIAHKMEPQVPGSIC